MSYKANILMLEDNENLLEINRDILQSEDCAVHTASSLAQAREILKTLTPDLAILDINLPDGSGLDFAVELREQYGTPIIFLSGKSGKENILAGLNAGAWTYIVKPYDLNVFRLTVKNFLDNMRNIE